MPPLRSRPPCRRDSTHDGSRNGPGWDTEPRCTSSSFRRKSTRLPAWLRALLLGAMAYRTPTSGAVSDGAWRCSGEYSSAFPTDGTIGKAMKEAFALSTKPRSENDDQDLEILLEAARRANWDALHGPRHLRSGRFNPEPEPDPKSDGGESERAER